MVEPAGDAGTVRAQVVRREDPVSGRGNAGAPSGEDHPEAPGPRPGAVGASAYRCLARLDLDRDLWRHV